MKFLITLLFGEADYHPIFNEMTIPKHRLRFAKRNSFLLEMRNDAERNFERLKGIVHRPDVKQETIDKYHLNKLLCFLYKNCFHSHSIHRKINPEDVNNRTVSDFYEWIGPAFKPDGANWQGLIENIDKISCVKDSLPGFYNGQLQNRIRERQKRIADQKKKEVAGVPREFLIEGYEQIVLSRGAYHSIIDPKKIPVRRTEQSWEKVLKFLQSDRVAAGKITGYFDSGTWQVADYTVETNGIPKVQFCSEWRPKGV